MNKISSFKLSGVSQANRQLNTFHPDYFRLDERDIDDLLVFAVNLSRHFNYYNLDNRPDGAWVHFFLMEPNILTRYIAAYDINSFIRKYDFIIGNLEQLLSIYELPPEDKLYLGFGELILLFDNIIDSQQNLDLYFHNVSASPKFRTIPEFINVTNRYEAFHNEIEKTQCTICKGQK